MKFTDDERVRHDTRHVEGFSLAETILAERTDALAARVSQLEGSTRAALLRLDQRINVHEGDLAEQLASTNECARRIQAIEVGLEQSDFMREADAAPIGRHVIVEGPEALLLGELQARLDAKTREVERLTNERDAIREVVKAIAKAHGFEPNTDLAPLLASVRAAKSGRDERIEALQADLEHAQLDAARKIIAVIEKELGVE